MKRRLFNWLLSLTLISGILGLPIRIDAQFSPGHPGFLFYQLNSSHGLSDNHIHDMAIDSSGNLWLGTSDGLNMYNGRTVSRFFREQYPEIKSDKSRQLLCDASNRIWLLTSDNNVTVLDEERRFHSVILRKEGVVIPIRRMIYLPDAGLIFFTREGHYQLGQDVSIASLDSITAEHCTSLTIVDFEELYDESFRQIETLDGSRVLFVTPERFYIVNYHTKRVEKVIQALDLKYLVKWSDDHLLVQYRETWQLQLLDLRDGSRSFPFENVYDQHGKQFNAEVTYARLIDANQLLISARLYGLYHYDRHSGQLTHHAHQAANPNTIVNNEPSVITADKNGWVFVAAPPNGVSYYHSKAIIGQHSLFLDDRGNGYDGAIGSITSLDNDTYFLAASEFLIKWQRSTNRTEFICIDSLFCQDPAGPEVFYLRLDAQQRLWVSAQHLGVFILDQNLKLIKHLKNAPGTRDVLSANYVRHIVPGPDGYMWLCTDMGVCRVHLQTLAVDRLLETPLSKLNQTYCHFAWFADEDHVWIATSGNGAWEYSLSTQELVIHNKDNGLISNEVFCINKDKEANIYVGTAHGLTILLSSGEVMTLTTEDGLLSNRIEALLLDQKGRMWMGNDVALSCFNIADTTVKVFEERHGLSAYGFHLIAYHQNTDDELVWGTEHGIRYFYPENLYTQTIALPTSITRLESKDVVRELTQDAVVKLSPSSNYVTFYFSSIDFSRNLQSSYQYRLEGLDENWVSVIDENSVRYRSLPGGTYTFRVRARNNDNEWIDSENKVTIIVAERIWNQTWFRALAALFMGLISWRIFRFYKNRHQRQKEEFESQIVINYFASRINSYRKTEDLLWDVAEHCISKLHFEDCVIYLLDEHRGVLLQKAAYGPKMDKGNTAGRVDFTIHQPLDIPLGQGIVGSVAQTGKAELIADTSLDRRYIVDDRRRNSELAVPMIIDNKVIGVIDSEHSRKQFFTQKHLNILSTIAGLCANQIQRVRAEDEKQQAMIEALTNKQKVTESRLQSLRLQMNPHFLFNALNSIQQMILANEEMVATRYLSRFSRLLRTILIHSDKEMVTLKEELDILRLYVDLEAVRFKDAFQYSIDCDEDIDIDEVKIPTLLIQPFVENAIWHGLMHKENDRQLTVNFFEAEDKLHCIIEDNGIGREKAQELKLTSGHGKDHTSKGIAVSIERLRSMSGGNGHAGSLQIVDLKDAGGRAIGTRVEIVMPVQS